MITILEWSVATGEASDPKPARRLDEVNDKVSDEVGRHLRGSQGCGTGEKLGARERGRTSDQGLMSPLLYH